jgi:hypothetical protein
MEEDSHQSPAVPPASPRATWQITMVELLIAGAMILKIAPRALHL